MYCTMRGYEVLPNAAQLLAQRARRKRQVGREASIVLSYSTYEATYHLSSYLSQYTLLLYFYSSTFLLRTHISP